MPFEIFAWFCKCPWDKCFRVYLSLGLDFSLSVSYFLANVSVLLGTLRVCSLTHIRTCILFSIFSCFQEKGWVVLAQLEKLLFKVVLCIQGPCIPRNRAFILTTPTVQAWGWSALSPRGGERCWRALLLLRGRVSSFVFSIPYFIYLYCFIICFYSVGFRFSLFYFF